MNDMMNRFGFTYSAAHGRVPEPFVPLQDEPHEVEAVHARKNTKTVLIPQIQSMKDYILKHCKRLIFRALNQGIQDGVLDLPLDMDWGKPKHSKEHPTMKPIPLLAYPIKNSSAPYGVVMDLFGGSTLMACEQTDRICRTMELDPRYASVIVQRYATYKEDINGIKVIRNGKEMTYDEVAVPLFDK